MRITFLQTCAKPHLEDDMFLEYVLDAGNLIFRLALRERRRFRTAIEHRTVVSEFRHF